ncbi:MAG: multidrug efflux pump [Clostridiales bacterium]|nr:multidrug efflux pump [Clostridiales bacterium]
MNKLLGGVINNRRILIFIIALLFIYGIYNFGLIPRQESPDVSAPVVIVTCQYPGASPDEVMSRVTSVIEDEIKEIPSVEEYNSTAMENASVTVVYFEFNANMDEGIATLRTKMEDIQVDLPDACDKITIDSDLMETAGMLISISSDEFDYDTLGQFGEELRDILSKVDGISRVDLVGKRDYNLKITLKPEDINQYNISYSDVINLLKAQNIDIPSGKLDGMLNKISVTTKGSFEDVDEVGNVIVAVSEETGAVVRLKDIATVALALDDDAVMYKQNGDNAIILAGYFKQDLNVVTIGEEVKALIDDYQASLPSAVSFDEIMFQPQDVHNRVSSFMMSLLQGILFVIVVVFIGMGLRNALVVSFAIPLSVMITFTSMTLFDIDIHQISIAALIIALGMLVDNAIVVSDSIQAHIDDDEPKLEACINGVKEVAIPVLTSTLTTVAVFLPLMMLDSTAGEFVKSLPIIVMVALSASYLVAIFVTPTLGYIFFKKSKETQSKFRVRHIFESILKYALGHKLVILVIVIVAVAGGVRLASTLGLQFFPSAESDLVYINVTNDVNTSIEDTEKLVEHVEAVIAEQPLVVSYSAAIGESFPKFYYTLPVNAASTDFSQIIVKLDTTNKAFVSNKAFVATLQKEMDSRISGGKVLVKELEQAEPIGSPVKLRVTGSSIDELRHVSNELVEIFNSIPGTTNVESNLKDKSYGYYVEVDDVKAGYYGLTKYDIQNEVSIALRGREATELRMTDDTYNIMVDGGIESLDELENIYIKSSFTDKKIPLKEVATVRLKEKNSVIKTYMGDVEIQVTSDVLGGYSSIDIQHAIGDRIVQSPSENVHYVFDGEEQSISKNFGSIGVSAVFALFLIYLILLLQFRSFLYPFIIFASIPLSSIGSIIGLYLFKQPLSFTALFGIVSLFGIVVNNAIVLLDFISAEVKSGSAVDVAVRDAMAKRFRPIMLSSITTIMGLVPLVASKSPLFMPMSIALMSGLIISTLLTLILIPVIYDTLFNHNKMNRKKKAQKAFNE